MGCVSLVLIAVRILVGNALCSPFFLACSGMVWGCWALSGLEFLGFRVLRVWVSQGSYFLRFSVFLVLKVFRVFGV